jgi:hypothetical protein
MKKVIVRHDLMKKIEYAKKYNLSRPTVDKKIEEGLLVVERIGETDYIKVK